MIKLFKRDGYEIKVEPEALLLKPFKKIWNRDRSKDKNRAMQELGFIYFVCDPRSDYQYLVDLDTRMESVKQGEGLPNDWTPDQTVKEAMEFYSSFKPTSALLLEDTRVAVDKLREHLKNMDFNEVDDKGKPKYTLNTITSTIKQIPELIKGLDEAEKAVTSDIREMSKARGNHENAIMEDV
jgi:hypothetical protein